MQEAEQHPRFETRLSIGANILEFNSIVHSLVDDVPLDSEVPVVTSSIREFVGSIFKDAHRVVAWGCQKKRDETFLASGVAEREAHATDSSVVERASSNCVLVPRL